MNGGVSRAQFDCDVDEHAIQTRVAQMSCTRRKTRGSWSLICLVFAMFWLFRHAVRKQPPLIKKVQWSSFEKRRGDDVMSTSFWFQGVQCVACFVVCPHFVFKFGFACRVAGVWVRIRLRQCVRCVFTVFLALSHVWLLCCRRSPRLFNMVAHCVEGMFSVSVVCSLSNISGSHV